jgi:hypothetical protein
MKNLLQEKLDATMSWNKRPVSSCDKRLTRQGVSGRLRRLERRDEREAEQGNWIGLKLSKWMERERERKEADYTPGGKGRKHVGITCRDR